jgi:hypothetical protein
VFDSKFDGEDVLLEGAIADDVVAFWVEAEIPSSKRATRLETNRECSKPTKASRFDRPSISTNCRGAPRSRCWRNLSGSVVKILKPLLVARETQLPSALKVTVWMISVEPVCKRCPY